MIQDGLVNDDIKRQVLRGLEPVAVNYRGITNNGDLKETVFVFALKDALN